MLTISTRSKLFVLTFFVAAATSLLLASADRSTATEAGPQIGVAAPTFSGTDSNGNTVDLSAFSGQKVILEWTNHDCPYVRKHYDESLRNMQTLQASTTEAGAVWLSVVSSAPGKQGHVTADQANQLSESRGASPTAVILDEDGAIGRMYGAKTTPHMFIIDEAGVLQYMGAIDSKRSSNPGDIPNSTNYVTQALGELGDGNAVTTPVTQPYGCSVKDSG